MIHRIPNVTAAIGELLFSDNCSCCRVLPYRAVLLAHSIGSIPHLYCNSPKDNGYIVINAMSFFEKHFYTRLYS